MFTNWIWNYLRITLTLVLTTTVSLGQGNFQDRLIGCYGHRGQDNSAINYTVFGDQNMTLDKCSQKARLTVATYFGVAGRYYCFYGDSYDRFGRLDTSRCDRTCGGNSAQTCGGKSDEAISVYSVCPPGSFDPREQTAFCRGTCNNCNNTNHLNRSLCYRSGVCVGGCQGGWEGPQCNSDVNECTTNRHECEHNCTNTEGSYTCSCRGDGYSLDSNKRNCTDIDECTAGTHDCEQHCTNTEGSFTCSCREGYELDSNQRNCNDIDECTRQTSGCAHNCTNLIGSYRCFCRAGYYLGADNHNCIDINDCDTNNGGCNHQCTNTESDFYCSCNSQGYRLLNKTFCQDINECTNSSYGSNGRCEQVCNNGDGSYYCSCEDGYYLESDLKKCADIDECSNSSYGQQGGCEHRCSNTGGSYFCFCPKGFFLKDDHKHCEDINECTNSSYGQNGGCQQICNNTVASYSCACEKHYSMANDGKHCEDKDDCVDGGGCEHYCYNREGDERQCYCKLGYIAVDTRCIETLWVYLYPTIGVATSLLVVAIVSGIFFVIIIRRNKTRREGAVQLDSKQMNTLAWNMKTVEPTDKLYENADNECKQIVEQAEEAGGKNQSDCSVYSIIPESSYEALTQNAERRITYEPYQELTQWSDKHEK